MTAGPGIRDGTGACPSARGDPDGRAGPASRRRRVTRHELRLLAAALAEVIRARAGLSLHRHNGLRRRIARLAAGAAAAPAVPTALAEVAWSVSAAERAVPGASCLTQALAGQALLARRGIGSRVELTLPAGAEGFRPHAWLIADDHLILGGSAAVRSVIAFWPPTPWRARKGERLRRLPGPCRRRCRRRPGGAPGAGRGAGRRASCRPSPRRCAQIPRAGCGPPAEAAAAACRACGLAIASDLDLPELAPAEGGGPADLSIRRVAQIALPPEALAAPSWHRFAPDGALFRWAEVGAFAVAGDGSRIEAAPNPGTPDALVAFPLLGPVLAEALRRQGLDRLARSLPEAIARDLAGEAAP